MLFGARLLYSDGSVGRCERIDTERASIELKVFCLNMIFVNAIDQVRKAMVF